MLLFEEPTSSNSAARRRWSSWLSWVPAEPPCWERLPTTEVLALMLFIVAPKLSSLVAVVVGTFNAVVVFFRLSFYVAGGHTSFPFLPLVLAATRKYHWLPTLSYGQLLHFFLCPWLVEEVGDDGSTELFRIRHFAVSTLPSVKTGSSPSSAVSCTMTRKFSFV